MKTPVIVNGLPGKMAVDVVKEIEECEDYKLVPVSLTGASMPSLYEGNEKLFHLYRPDERDSFRFNPSLKDNKDPLIVDYTHSSAVANNVELYCKNGWYFVMGTTGGDLEWIKERVLKSDISCVVAPNMSMQIVALMSIMEYAANRHLCQDAFREFSLEIEESYQSSKADTSGTAKAMVKHFNELGIRFKENQIVKIRDREEQLFLGVEEKYLDGHAWHTYKLKSKQLGVEMEFKHNVNGRRTYVEGTMKALKFIEQARKSGIAKKVYSMEDIFQ